MYRYKRGVGGGYDRQGYVFFVSRQYKYMPRETQKKIRRICCECGGEYSEALFEFVTRDTTATEIELKYYLSKSTLYRIVRKYYDRFPDWV